MDGPATGRRGEHLHARQGHMDGPTPHQMPFVFILGCGARGANAQEQSDARCVAGRPVGKLTGKPPHVEVVRDGARADGVMIEVTVTLR
jgi:hypothetical protein